MTAEFNH